MPSPFPIRLWKAPGNFPNGYACWSKQRLWTFPGMAPLRITMPFPSALRNGSRKDFDAVMRRADRALYEAKTSGRNRVQIKTLLPA